MANGQSYSFFNEYDLSETDMFFRSHQTGDSSIFVVGYANYNNFICKIGSDGQYLNHLYPAPSVSGSIFDEKFEVNGIRLLCTVTDGPYMGMPGHYKVVTTNYNLDIINEFSILDTVQTNISSGALNSRGTILYHGTSLPRLTQWDHDGNLIWTFYDSSGGSWNGPSFFEMPSGGIKVITSVDTMPQYKVFELDSTGQLTSMYNWGSIYVGFNYSNNNLYSVHSVNDTIPPYDYMTEIALRDPITYVSISSTIVNGQCWNLDLNTTNNLAYGIFSLPFYNYWTREDVKIVAFDNNFNEAYSHTFPATMTSSLHLWGLSVNDNGEILATGLLTKYDTTGFYINQQYSSSSVNAVLIKLNSDLTIIGMTMNYIPPAILTYPNPVAFSGIINFDIDPSISSMPNLSYTISNSNGITQASGPLIADPFDLDISTWQNGMYFIFIYSNGSLVGHSQFMKI